MSEDKIRILIVEGRFYSDLADALLAGATDAISAFGAEYDVITVPGALEIPAVIAIAEDAGSKGVRYDGYVALGTVIRGETYHFEIVANESASGVSGVMLDFGIPIGNGILTCDTDAQALARMDAKGYEAALAALELANLSDAVDDA